MEFKKAFNLMKKGYLLKRKEWEGYWALEQGAIMMHCRGGTVIDLRKSKDTIFTVDNMLEDDWEIATEKNCKILRPDCEKINRAAHAGSIDVDININTSSLVEIKEELINMDLLVDKITRKIQGMY